MKKFAEKELIPSREVIDLNLENASIEDHFPICNPFEKISYSTENSKTNRSINTKSLQYYASKCKTVLYRSDWISAISKEDHLKYCPLFDIPNATNSSDKFLNMEDFLSSNFTTGESVQVLDGITISKISSTIDQDIYMINVSYEGNTFPIMRFSFYSENSGKCRQNWYKSKLDIYWKAFRLEDITGWKFTISRFLFQLFARYPEFMEDLHKFYITRFDYKFDFFTEKWELYPSYVDIFRRKRKALWERKDIWLNCPKKNDTSCPYGVKNRSGEILTGWNLWKKWDQYIYTRLYHKQVEIYDNNLGDLYWDYLDYDWEIRRLEFEFGSRFCSARWNVRLLDELRDNRLSRIVFEYLWIIPKTWYFNKRYDLHIPFEKKSALQKRRLYSTFINTSKTYSINDINPFVVASVGLTEEEIKKHLENFEADRKSYWERKDIFPKINPNPYLNFSWKELILYCKSLIPLMTSSEEDRKSLEDQINNVINTYDNSSIEEKEMLDKEMKNILSLLVP